MKKFLVTIVALGLCGVALTVSAAEMQVIPKTAIPCGSSLSRVHNIVLDAALGKDWEVLKDNKGRMRLRYAKGSKFHADIEVVYSGSQFQIRYVDSHGLGYERKNGKAYIHRNYNKWIANLAKIIRNQANKTCRRQ